jgi:hypothetical protein
MGFASDAMITVNVLKNWDYPDLMHQTPGNAGVWQDIKFLLETDQPTDYVVVLNYPSQDILVRSRPGRIWAIMQEPPTEFLKRSHRGDLSYSRVYTSDVRLRGAKYVHSHPALPWHVNRSYDYLKSADIPHKLKDISWVTSNQTVLQGHRDRMFFLQSIRDSLNFDLFGRGFEPVEDKWQALAPYRYSIAVENFSNPFYWSEKIADCFLSWTMPIYYGCSKIMEYFPAESMIAIDIHRPQESLEIIHNAIRSQHWKKNLDAIRFARELILDRYQFFPFVTEKIKQDADLSTGGKHESVLIPATMRIPLTFGERATPFFDKFYNMAKKNYRKLKDYFS